MALVLSLSSCLTGDKLLACLVLRLCICTTWQSSPPTLAEDFLSARHATNQQMYLHSLI